MDLKNITEQELIQLYHEVEEHSEEWFMIENEILRRSELKKRIIPKIPIKLDNYLDNAEQFYRINPFFFDEQETWWLWDFKTSCWKIIDEVDLMDKFDTMLGLQGQTIASRVKSSYLEAFKRLGRRKKPKDAPLKWIQFKNKAFSLQSYNVYDVTPDYFFTNPIPYEMSNSTETPIMDKLFTEWVGHDNVKTLYEIIAYCCYRSYPIQILFSLYGNGRNGKSCFLRILSNFFGKENICSTELDLLVGHNSSRFESFKLYKKLLCQMGETNFGILDKSSMLKKLTGSDMIGYEMKGKKPFDDFNYAKMIIASNSLPSSDDTSDGFYRRWLIINFPNEFPEGKDILETIPPEEYNNLATKCMEILPQLLKKGEFTGQGSIMQRRENYIMASNPLPLFIHNCCEVSENNTEIFISFNELYNAYIQYLKINKKRRVKIKEFKQALSDEGYFPEKTSKPDGFDDKGYQKYKVIQWVDCIKLKINWRDFCLFCSFY